MDATTTTISVAQQLTPFLLTGLGAASAIGLSALGAAYGTWKTSEFMFSLEKLEGAVPLKYFTGIVMCGVLSIYGLIIAIIIASNITDDLSIASGAVSLASGLTVGFACLFSGIAIGRVHPAKGNAPERWFTLVLMQIYCEAIGLYGLIVALVLNGNGSNLIAVASNAVESSMM
eukprot:TRINITY_DN11930_c0_g1_i1.p1 TRINITY_DN11930_c0_g1~~TRINITY_DN11930_c0_g1_i1.p1  ORF type:complete len:174 (-),score=55.36 TRINITY_DN11930_c0_g1_i1:72-593(-)